MDMFTTIAIILTILLVGLLGVVCGLFSYFLDYCFWPGSIFKAYLPWLASKMVSKSDRAEIMMLKPDLRGHEFVKRAENVMLFKLMGGCIYCLNIWFTFLTFSILNCFLDFGWYYIFVYTTMSHFFLRKILD